MDIPRLSKKSALDSVLEERKNQEEIWGEQNRRRGYGAARG